LEKGGSTRKSACVYPSSTDTTACENQQTHVTVWLCQTEEVYVPPEELFMLRPRAPSSSVMKDRKNSQSLVEVAPTFPPTSSALAALGFVDKEEPDADGLFKGLILPTEQYNFLWRSSFQGFISFSLAVARGYYDLCWFPLLVTLTSLNYWRRPDYSWRRYIDMAAIQCMYYQLWRAWGAENRTANYAFTAIAIAFFFMGVFAYSQKRYWAATLLHFCAHCCSNMSNIVLYVGYVPPLTR
jgi:hypothetical protein